MSVWMGVSQVEQRAKKTNHRVIQKHAVTNRATRHDRLAHFKKKNK